MRMRPLILLVLTVLLYYFSFPPFPTPFLSWFSLVPFFWALHRSGFRNSFAIGYGTGLLAIGSMMFWLTSNTGATTGQAISMYIGSVIYLALGWGAFAWVQSRLYRRWQMTSFWMAPFVWTGIEYLQSQGPLGFTWHSLATPQSVLPGAIQYASVTGMFGVTFWVVSVNVLSFFLLSSWRQLLASKRLRKLSVLGAVILLPFLHGRLVIPDTYSASSLRVGMVQPNVEPNVKWLDRDFAFRELMKWTQTLNGRELDLLIWPETAVPNRLRIDQRKLQPLREELLRQNTVLLTGFPDRRILQTDSGAVVHSYNSVMMLDPHSDRIAVYDKIHLVPFGEHVPSFLNWLGALAMEVGDFGYAPGAEPVVFDVRRRGREDTVRVASVICLESIFPHLVRRFVREGAQLLVIVTNDAWYDGTDAPTQHAFASVYRAIENRISIARCANSGVSCFVDPWGRMTNATENGLPAVIAGSVWVREGQNTLYTDWGDVFPQSMLAIAFSLVMASWTRHRITS